MRPRRPPGERAYLNCLGPTEFIKDVFLDSDTDLMVLSFVPSIREGEPLTIEEAAATREIVEKMEGSKRLMLHGRVNPNQPGDVEDMERLAGFGVSAFKTYTQWGPGGAGFWMTDDVGIAFVEKARKLGVRNIAIHKGLPFGPQELRAFDLPRHRPDRQALPRHELPHLPFAAMSPARRRGPTTRRAPTASTL